MLQPHKKRKTALNRALARGLQHALRHRMEYKPISPMNAISCSLSITLLALSFLSGLVAPALAAEPGEQPDYLKLVYEASGKEASKHISYYADTQGTQNISDIATNSNIFVPLLEKRFNLNVHTHWYKIPLSIPDDNPYNWVMSTGVSAADLVNAYWLPEGSGIEEIQKIEGRSKFENIDFPISIVLLPLELPPGSKGILFIEYQSLANFPLIIKPFLAEKLLSRNLKVTLINGISLGAIGVFLLFYCVQFFIRPTRVLGYYTLFIFFFIVFVAQIFGYGIQFFWPGHNHLSSVATSFMGGAIYIWYFLFTSELFQLKKKSPNLHKVLLGFSAAIFTFMILGFFIPTDFLLSLLIVFGLPWPVVTGFWAARRKHPSAVFFLIGSGIHCLMAYLLLVVCMGLETGINSYIFGMASAGQVIDIACFSVAILFQNNQIREQFNQQLEERLQDMQFLAESEQESAEMLSLSQKTLLHLATTAHDLVQPLSSIKLNLAAQNTPVSKQLNISIEYANSLLNSILKKSKIDYLSLQEKTKINVLLEEIFHRHEKSFGDAGVNLRFKSSEKEAPVLRLVVNRVVDNLLSNALRHTESGSVLLAGRFRKDHVLVQVWDTGPGMPDSKVNQLLAPFESLDDGAHISGFGLGLFIVKSLCDDAGYTLNIKSREGKGSCFEIRIPLQNDIQKDNAKNN